MKDFFPYAYFDGQVVRIEDAKVSVTTHALQYGTGCFGGIRGYLSSDGQSIRLFRLKDHFNRLHRSAQLLKIKVPLDTAQLIDLTCELVNKNAVSTDVYFRPYAYKAGMQLGPNLDKVADGFTMYSLPMGNYFKKEHGLALMVSSWTRPEDNAIPARAKVSGAYVNSSLAKDDAEAHGFDDAIMLNSRGKVSEASAANLFMVREGQLITTPTTSDILEGITRKTLMELAAGLGIPFVEREIDRTELYICDEVFLCGTGVQLTPVTSIDRRNVGSGQVGEITARLLKQFRAIIRGDISDFDHWITSVPAAVKVS